MQGGESRTWENGKGTLGRAMRGRGIMGIKNWRDLRKGDQLKLRMPGKSQPERNLLTDKVNKV